jgi:hypothetical protein
MRSTEVPQHYAVSTEERVIGSFTYNTAEFADTAERVGTVPEGIDAMIDGRVGWGEASQTSPFAEFLSWRPKADEVVPMFQPLLRGEPVPVNGADAVAGDTGFLRVGLNPDVPFGAPERQLTSQLSRAAAARSAARLTSSAWRPGTAAMAPFDSRVSGAPA